MKNMKKNGGEDKQLSTLNDKLSIIIVISTIIAFCVLGLSSCDGEAFNTTNGNSGNNTNGNGGNNSNNGNSGKDFIYNDDFSETEESYMRRTGQLDEHDKKQTQIVGLKAVFIQIGVR